MGSHSLSQTLAVVTWIMLLRLNTTWNEEFAGSALVSSQVAQAHSVGQNLHALGFMSHACLFLHYQDDQLHVS